MQNICFWTRICGDLPSDEQIQQEVQRKYQLYRRRSIAFHPSETPYDELLVNLANHIQFHDEEEFWDIVDQVLENLDQLTDYITNIDRSKLQVALQVNRLWFDAPDEITIPTEIMPVASRLELPLRIGMLLFLPEEPPEDEPEDEPEQEPASQSEDEASATKDTGEESEAEAVADGDGDGEEGDASDEDTAEDEEYEERDEDCWWYYDEDEEDIYVEDEDWLEDEEEEDLENSSITLSLRFQGLILNMEMLERQLPTTFMIGERAFYTSFEQVDYDVYTMELAHWPYTDGDLLDNPDMQLAIEAINYMLEDLLLLQYAGIEIELLLFNMRYQGGGFISLPVALSSALAAAGLPLTIGMDVSWRTW